MNTNRIIHLFLWLFIFLLTDIGSAQNENAKWYMPYVSLDFMTNPPTLLLTNGLTPPYAQGVASHADQNGNLLFYSNGATVYNKNHLVMANGTGLLGNNLGRQNCLIVRQPGSANLHYIFTVQGNKGAAGFNYSIVDMSLATGLGSVTVKNQPVYPAPCEEKLMGTQHCNGQDYWIVTHESNSNNFRSYLFSAAGLNTTAVISSVGLVSDYWKTPMKFSPGGNKLAALAWYFPSNFETMDLYDFDTSTGLVSNHQSIYTGLRDIYGMEFSPDGSKLYSGDNFADAPNYLHQWDICAGSPSAVIASHYTIAASQMGMMQLALNGKIYVAAGQTTMPVINSPNNAGPACNFIWAGQSLGGIQSYVILPNFINRYKSVLAPFSHSLVMGQVCHALSFTANLPVVSCASSNYSVSAVSWDFGDPTTGPLNTSTAFNPLHVYSSAGTYTATLIFKYKCGGDTLRQVVTVPPPYIAVTWSPSCNNTASATATAVGGVGPYSYTWSPSSQTGSLVSNLSAGSHSVALTDHGLACNVSSVITVTTQSPPVFSLTPKDSLSVCAGSSAIVMLSGNATSYTWHPSAGLSLNGTTLLINPAVSQNYTVKGALNSCTSAVNLRVNVLPLPVPIIVMDKNSFCINTELKLKGLGGEKYEWAGPAGFQSEQQEPAFLVKAGDAAGVYTLTVSDLYGCKNSTTALLSIVPPPQGILKGFKGDGCVPFCSDFNFTASKQPSSIVSSWEINRRVYGDNFSYCFNEAGTYTITGTLTDSVSMCADKVSYLVKVNPRPGAAYYHLPENPVESDQGVTFINASTGSDQTQWSWYFHGAGTSLAVKQLEGESVSNYFPDAGDYLTALVVTNKWDCSDTVIKSLRVKEDFSLYVPNTFSPNDDSRNDIFLPVVRGAALFNLRVFNRWGALLFESADPSTGWDGSYQGQTVKEDIYVWTLNLTSARGEYITRKGHVTLIR